MSRKPPPESTIQPRFRFVDLFSGIGGFHAALSAFGGECVYAVEIDAEAAAVYERNWGIKALGDVTKDADRDAGIMNVPAHDVLVAGFPCQPFSKSGAQRGMDETRGTLFFNIATIIEHHHPHVVLLENVRNLAGPRHTHEWDVIIETLRDSGYRVSEVPTIFSPHQLPPERGGRPQVRERVFIAATHDPEGITAGIDVPPVVPSSSFVDGWDPAQWHLEDLLDDSESIAGCELSESEVLWIDAWDDWVKTWLQATKRRPPGMPIWADSWLDVWDSSSPILKKFGHVPDFRELMGEDPQLPKWKAGHMAKNYALFAEHKNWIQPWAEKWQIYTDAFPASRRKLEWQAQDTADLWATVMQLRPSGLRVKRPTYLPALVAITQTSIIGPRRRRLSPRETARMQGLPEWFDFGTQRPTATYKQMGNGVNVGAVYHVLREQVRRDEDLLKRTPVGQDILEAVLESPLSPDERLQRKSH